MNVRARELHNFQSDDDDDDNNIRLHIGLVRLLLFSLLLLLFVYACWFIGLRQGSLCVIVKDTSAYRTLI